MNGGPFYSAGACRLINGEIYRYRLVTFAHWVNLSHNHNYYEIKKGRKRIARVPEGRLEEWFKTFCAFEQDSTVRNPYPPAPKSGAAERGIRNKAGISVLPVAAGPGDEEDEGDDGLDDTRV
jgi:hypothetical protein